MTMDSFSMDDEDEDEEEMIKLEQELKAAQEKTAFLIKKKQEHIKISEDIKNSANDVNYKRKMENIERLQQD
ncbi:hypothetical protein ABG067_009175, partial [Albugo candida]